MDRIRSWFPVLLFVVLVSLAVASGLVSPSVPTADIAFSDFKGLVTGGKVRQVVIRGDAVDGQLFEAEPLEGQAAPTAHVRTRIPPLEGVGLAEALEKAGVKVWSESAEGAGAWGALVSFLPWLVILALYIWYWRRMSGNIAGGIGRGGPLDSLLHPPGARVKQVPDVHFADVAGQENAKREVSELVDFLRQPERYRRLGAEPPRGILLMGAPGTGKTLLARALAGEAGVPFFSISASEFIEVFVGVGASRVRNLFADAKKNAPAIVFIDELDSIGRVRGTGLGGGNDEREQTLNQILAELDGFSHQESVVVLAATNRPDVLDPALLRPGRFDRHITLELPDRKARLDILKVHVRNVPLHDDVDLALVARATPGFSGADLKNLVNEAAMMAARENTALVSARHFAAMRERVMLGSERSLAIGPDEKRRLAVHEAGHAVAAYFLPGADPLHKVSIVPRGRALGGTQQLPAEERYIMDEAYLRGRLAVILAGRVGEKMMLGTVSSGADDDIRQASEIARMMVSRWGMSDTVGPMDVRESEEHPFLGRAIAQPRQISEATAHDVDRAVRQILCESEGRSDEILRAHRDGFERLAAALEESETLERDRIDAILAPPAETTAGAGRCGVGSV